MTALSLSDLRSLAARIGFPDPATAAAVAMAESQGVPSAVNVVTSPGPGALPERSFGLWQINTLAHPQYDEQLLLDPDYNARAAFAVSSGGVNWQPWSTFTHGNYLAYMPVFGETVTPPVARQGSGSQSIPTVLAAVAALGLAAAAGYTAHHRREVLS